MTDERLISENTCGILIQHRVSSPLVDMVRGVLKRKDDLIEPRESVSENQIPLFDTCPDCGASAVVHEGGCANCKACGWGKCNS